MTVSKYQRGTISDGGTVTVSKYHCETVHDGGTVSDGGGGTTKMFQNLIDQFGCKRSVKMWATILYKSFHDSCI